MFPPSRLLASALRSVLPRVCDQRDRDQAHARSRRLEADLEQAQQRIASLTQNLADSKTENQQHMVTIELERKNRADAQERGAALHEQLADAKRKNANLERDLAEEQQARKHTEADKARVSAELAEGHARISELSRRIAEFEAPLRSEIEALSCRNQELSDAIAAKEQLLDGLELAHAPCADKRRALQEEVQSLKAQVEELRAQNSQKVLGLEVHIARLGQDLSAAEGQRDHYMALGAKHEAMLAQKEGEMCRRQAQLDEARAACDAEAKCVLEQAQVVKRLESQIAMLETEKSNLECKWRALLQQATSEMQLKEQIRKVRSIEAVRSQVAALGGIEFLEEQRRADPAAGKALSALERRFRDSKDDILALEASEFVLQESHERVRRANDFYREIGFEAIFGSQVGIERNIESMWCFSLVYYDVHRWYTYVSLTMIPHFE
jgi:chromosome segregation ATPase